MRSPLNVVVMLSLLSPLALIGSGGAVVPTSPPNVLIIMTDDQRLQDTMEFMPKTMKWFGEGGTAYSQAFITVPICCPSRAGIWTGQYSHNSRVLTTADAGVIDENGSIQRYLHDAGYKTAAYGKFFNSFSLNRNPLHFDDWAFHASGYTNVAFNVHGTRATIPFSPLFIREKALDYLASTEANDAQPWYLYLTPYAPHSPWIAEEKYANTLFPPWLGNPATQEVDRSDKPPHMQTTVPLASAAAGVPFERGPEGFTTLAEVATSVPFDRQIYLRTLLTVDDTVDLIMTQLAAQGELDNTFAIFMSDHGYLWGEHGWYNKLVPYTASIQIPFFVRWPAGGVEGGAHSDRLISSVDILPSILDAAGLAPDPTKNHDGRSFLQDEWTREHAFVEYWGQGLPLGNPVPHWATIRSDDWQYVEYYNNQGAVTFRELYDLVDDPWQLENRYRATNLLDPVPQSQTDALSAKLLAARTCRGSTGPTACP